MSDQDAGSLIAESDRLVEQVQFGPEALEVNEALVGVEPGNSQAWSRLGRCYETADRLEDAARAFGTALKIEPDMTVPRNHLQDCLKWIEARRKVQAVAAERGEVGLRSFISSLRDDPASNRVRLEGRRRLVGATGAAHDYVGLGRELGKAGALDQALGAFRKAVELDRSTLDAATVGAAAVMRRMGRPDRAIALCERVLQSSPNDPYALNTMGAALHDQGRLDEAESAFGRAKGSR